MMLLLMMKMIKKLNYCQTLFWLLAFISNMRLNKKALVPWGPNPETKES